MLCRVEHNRYSPNVTGIVVLVIAVITPVRPTVIIAVAVDLHWFICQSIYAGGVGGDASRLDRCTAARLFLFSFFPSFKKEGRRKELHHGAT